MMLNSGSMEPDVALRLSVVFTSGRGEIHHLCHLKETKGESKKISEGGDYKKM